MYDIIGDIHGQAGELEALLKKLGYELLNGAYQHQTRKVIFLGDFIDRGKRERDVIKIVRPMVATGSALAVMGNHEFNAIAYHTVDPDQPSEFLRERSDKNTKQHEAFLNEYKHSTEEWADVIAWFKTLPLWLDLGELRIIHACWHDPSMKLLGSQLAENNTLTEELLVKSSRKGSPEYEAVEILLKGLEVELPAGISFSDKEGNVRTEIRTRWWLSEPSHYSDVALGLPSMSEPLPDEAFDMTLLAGYPADAPPVFVGHYWMNGEPNLLEKNVVCTDYSVAKPGGQLVAYQYNSGEPLDASNFVSVESTVA